MKTQRFVNAPQLVHPVRVHGPTRLRGKHDELGVLEEVGVQHCKASDWSAKPLQESRRRWTFAPASFTVIRASSCDCFKFFTSTDRNCSKYLDTLSLVAHPCLIPTDKAGSSLSCHWGKRNSMDVWQVPHPVGETFGFFQWNHGASSKPSKISCRFSSVLLLGSSPFCTRNHGVRKQSKGSSLPARS